MTWNTLRWGMPNLFPMLVMALMAASYAFTS